MARSGRKRWNMGVALVAAYMLALQALIGAFALGAAAASPQLDAFGNPLCITGTGPVDSQSGGPGGKDHTPLPDCCTVGCTMFAPATAGDRSPASLANPLALSHVQQRTPSDTSAVSHPLDESPGSPRAPPLTV